MHREKTSLTRSHVVIASALKAAAVNGRDKHGEAWASGWDFPFLPHSRKAFLSLHTDQDTKLSRMKAFVSFGFPKGMPNTGVDY